MKGARAVPLPGFEVNVVSPPLSDKSDAKHAFRLTHGPQTLVFAAHDGELLAKWVELLTKASRGESPTDGAGATQTDHRKSQ